MLISKRGECTVAGLPLVVTGEGEEALPGTVLNYLHQIAKAMGHPVLATVHDARSGCLTPITVGIDGSSKLAGEPEYVPPGYDRASQALTPLGPTGSDGSPESTTQASVARPSGQQVSRDSTDGASPGPDFRVGVEPSTEALGPRSADVQRRPTDPDGAGSPGGTRIARQVLPTEEAIPRALAAAVTRINEHVHGGHLDAAAATVRNTLGPVTQEFGAEHGYVLQLRELQAHIAYLAGDAERSMAISLSVCRAWMRRHDPGAYGTLMRAAAVWPGIREPRQGIRQGEELIRLWTTLAGADESGFSELDRLAAARERMTRLEARAARAT
ncbi:hypothetical protein [Streptomyces sp. NPDC059816]|uniref:hypothetical protein n=1 Tax=Streptomyces sp. NPDC059816 TaxID=3346960 RepID=UPI00364B3743